MFDFLINNKIFLSLILVAAIIVVKILFVKFYERRAKNKKVDKRLLINMVNNLFSVAIIIVLFNIWSEEIQKFAFSIAAFVVAIVLATREFIQCFIGFLYILSTSPFRIGDWVQVGENYGEVHSTDWAKLTILEVDIDTYQYTGKTLYIPNGLLITSTIKNLNFLKRYVTHHFTITRNCEVNPFEFIKELNAKAESYCSDFRDVAVRYNQLIQNRLEIQISGPEPHIYVTTARDGHTQVNFTIFCPTERALEIEEKLTKDFMALWFAHKEQQAYR